VLEYAVGQHYRGNVVFGTHEYGFGLYPNDPAIVAKIRGYREQLVDLVQEAATHGIMLQISITKRGDDPEGPLQLKPGAYLNSSFQVTA